jgi:hypothetical protein
MDASLEQPERAESLSLAVHDSVYRATKLPSKPRHASSGVVVSRCEYLH